MQVDFSLPKDKETHKYCIECHKDGIQEVVRDGITMFVCPACGKVSERYIHIGNGLQDGKWWLDENNEMWHESVGVFVRNPQGRYLFFERTAFPLGYTMPAGHVDNGEGYAAAAARELQEEVGIASRYMSHIVDVDIVGDACVGGADAHRWHVYREDLPRSVEVTVKEEGHSPVWLTLDEALTKDLPLATRQLIEQQAGKIEAKPHHLA